MTENNEEFAECPGKQRKFGRSTSILSSSAKREYEVDGTQKLILRFGEHSIQGKRKTQEDKHTALTDVAKDKSTQDETIEKGQDKLAFFGVFDGHGGKMASDFVAENLHKYLMNDLPNTNNNIEESLRNSIQKVEADFLQKSLKEDLKDGTTAIVAVINENQLYVANVGDSELILCENGKAISLCPVHNPKRNRDEAARIEAEGGRLYNDRLAHPSLNPQIFNIAVSRAIGDIFFKHLDFTRQKPSALCAIPDVVSYNLTAEDDFAVLACDGLWDVMSHQDVVDFVLPKLKELDDPQAVSEQLVDEAYKRGSQDNITTLIVTFKHFK